MAAPPGPDTPPESLEAIHAAVAAANADLYRHLALYLQVLRSVLQQQVERACFHLVTRDYSGRYLRLSDEARLELHRRLTELVEHCSSLLTVEQLVALAAQMRRQRRQRLQKQHRELVRRLLRGDDILQPEDSETSSEEPTEAGLADPAVSLPPGSVRLQMTPPLGEAGLQWSFQPLVALDSAPEDRGDIRKDGEDATGTEAVGTEVVGTHAAAEDADVDADADAVDVDVDVDVDVETSDEANDEAFGEANDEAFGEADDQVDELGDQEGSDQTALNPAHPEDSDLDALSAQLLRSLGLADMDLSALLRPIPPADGEERPVRPQPLAAASEDSAPQASGESTGLLGFTAGESLGDGDPLDMGSTGDGEDDPDQQGLLPQDPLQLLQWLDGTERALARRLRLLSHAINTELLRSRISTNLLPPNLLEAVIRGQVETQASAPNVVRLQLPFGLQPGAPPLKTQAVLVRVVDLEMEEARLRTCRRRLQQHRQELRRMAQQYRRLQRRLQTREAERLWSQDIRRSRPQPD